MISDRHPRATKYCKSQWFCNKFALIQWPMTDTPGATEYCKSLWVCNMFALIQRLLTDTPGQQNTVNDNGFGILLL